MIHTTLEKYRCYSEEIEEDESVSLVHGLVIKLDSKSEPTISY